MRCRICIESRGGLLSSSERVKRVWSLVSRARHLVTLARPLIRPLKTVGFSKGQGLSRLTFDSVWIWKYIKPLITVDTMDFIIILIFSLFQLKICETDQIRALLLHVCRMGPMGLFQTVISGLIYFQIQTLSNVNLDKPFSFFPCNSSPRLNGSLRDVS
jgi:hypothetical protein